jgi:hypothetical protein
LAVSEALTTTEWSKDSMKMLAEYLEKAITFETLAAAENDAKVKADLIAQAKDYRKLATERATRYGLKHLSPQNPKASAVKREAEEDWGR